MKGRRTGGGNHLELGKDQARPYFRFAGIVGWQGVVKGRKGVLVVLFGPFVVVERRNPPKPQAM